jgi:hypothetical protein
VILRHSLVSKYRKVREYGIWTDTRSLALFWRNNPEFVCREWETQQQEKSEQPTLVPRFQPMTSQQGNRSVTRLGVTSILTTRYNFSCPVTHLCLDKSPNTQNSRPLSVLRYGSNERRAVCPTRYNELCVMQHNTEFTVLFSFFLHDSEPQCGLSFYFEPLNQVTKQSHFFTSCVHISNLLLQFFLSLMCDSRVATLKMVSF